MSMFGVFGSGGGVNLPTYTNQSAGGAQPPTTQPNPFGQYQQFMEGEANRQGGVPEGYLPVPGQPEYMRDIPDHRGGAMDIITTMRNPNYNPGLSGSEQVQGAAMADYMNLVNATDQHRARVEQAQNDFLAMIQGNAGDMRQSGIEARDMMMGKADEVSALGQELYDTTVAKGEQAVTDFENLSAQQTAAASAGLAAQNRSSAMQLEAGAKTGDPMAIQGLADLRADSQMRTAQTMTSLATQYNQQKANLQMQSAGLAGQAAGTRQAYESLASGMNTTGIQMAQAADTQAANYEAMGQGKYADWVRSSPFSPVAFLPTLMSFYQFSQTPGARKFEGFAPELIGMGETALA